MLTMFHGYLHELVGGLIGIGPRVRTDMFIHHVATMTLISSAYLLNLSRMGIMWQALFDISNPLLHTAKMMNTLKFPQTETIKWYVFAAFALAFFVARIVMAPIAIVWPALTQSTKVLPIEWSALPLSMMVVVCGIQWLWFYKIVRMATGVDKEPGKKTE
ncbi:TLC domain-containing protein [Dunaliella salina]|uniref:TLC domain-containing protein n=1 Tax=Dunaliella salina TaxID=3046 RepID=A0ABQ7FWF5_DUNSA|nr:TLC domain-containing protein [Dunaliella salina]|eukprot:KAF5826688.1 TLC domain-containing protein [Dunaliella salina]